MPSRPAVAVILAFWLGTTGLVFYRDAWPRLFGSGPPPIAIDLEDEARSAGAAVGIQWKLLRGDQKVGRLTTKMAHVDADDTFQFTNTYSEVRLDFNVLDTQVRVHVPRLSTTTRVTRSGELREQPAEPLHEIRGERAQPLRSRRLDEDAVAHESTLSTRAGALVEGDRRIRRFCRR